MRIVGETRETPHACVACRTKRVTLRTTATRRRVYGVNRTHDAPTHAVSDGGIGAQRERLRGHLNEGPAVGVSSRVLAHMG